MAHAINPNPTPYRYPQDALVEFDNGYFKGKGRVVGVATIGAPIIGRTYMVEVQESNMNLPNDEYPYTTVAMFETHMRFTAPYEQPILDSNGVMIEFSKENKNEN